MMVEVSLNTQGLCVCHPAAVLVQVPLRTCNNLILCTVLSVLLHFPVLRRGHQHHLAGQVPGTFKAGKEGRSQPSTWEP